jgi:hypothetical protein
MRVFPISYETMYATYSSLQQKDPTVPLHQTSEQQCRPLLPAQSSGPSQVITPPLHSAWVVQA